MAIKSTGVYMASVTMSEMPDMSSVKVSFSSEVLKMASVNVSINDLAKTTDAIYPPHLHNHYPLLINEG
jgi:hypothetical protein